MAQNNLMENPLEAITIKEYLEKMLREENISLKILEKNESKTCSYKKGAINQTIFGCRTCAPAEPFGICFGCFLSCHLEHDTFEIGLKRNFMCECGNMKIKNECALEPMKIDEAHKNEYDHNFSNKFCSCDQEYDPKAHEFMISCIFCLDFYHMECFKFHQNELKTIKESEEFSIMVCPKCLNGKYSFFSAYLKDSDVVLALIPNNVELNSGENKEQKENNEEKKEITENLQKKKKIDSVCPLESNSSEFFVNPIFLKENWFDNLCLCENCLKLSKNLQLEQIYKMKDENDYNEEEDVEISKENNNNNNIQEQSEMKNNLLYDQSLKEFSKLDFITQSNIANLYRDFYAEFLEFSRPFVEKNEIITKNHISHFFEELKKKKNIDTTL